ncbi:unnamed protein product [Rhizopus stolonifer]
MNETELNEKMNNFTRKRQNKISWKSMLCCGIRKKNKNSIKPTKGILKREIQHNFEKKRIEFKQDTIYKTYSRKRYDRRSDPDAIFTRLTPGIVQEIRQELNHFKLYEMSVHESSRINTHFFV